MVRKKVVIEIRRMGTNVRKLPSVRKAFISGKERWFWTNVENVLRPVLNPIVQKAAADGHISLIKATKRICEIYEEVGWT